MLLKLTITIPNESNIVLLDVVLVIIVLTFFLFFLTVLSAYIIYVQWLLFCVI